MRFINKLIALDLGAAEPLYQDAQQVIAQWDRDTNIENRGAALSSCVIGSEWLAEQKGLPEPDAMAELIRCADLLMAKTGRLDPLWGDVSRHVRGDLNLPVGGGPDTLRAIYGFRNGRGWFSHQRGGRWALHTCCHGMPTVNRKFAVYTSMAQQP